jgi:hypothetical protein
MTTLRADIPDAIDVVVRRALEPDRDKRWPDLDSFLNALREAHTTGKVPVGLVPAAQMPTAVATPGGVDQATALASANQLTVATPARRSGRSRVIAALAAVVLAAAGGYGGYQFVLSRPVKVTSNDGLSVDAPRAWSQKAENSTGPRLLVSSDTSKWQTSRTVEGVFLEVVVGTTLPTTTTPPPGCQPGSLARGKSDDDDIVTVQYECDGPAVVERYRQLDGGKQLRVQVRDSDATQREEVLGSATYSP